MGTLFVVATPIGNLEDITFRAVRILKEANIVLCEDTRVTKKLLSHFGLKTPTLSYHQHSDEARKEYIFQLLSQGKNLALVSDSGTPGVSDPGNELIQFLLEKDRTIKIFPVPGPSAVAALASVSGFPMSRFLFLGYPPQKKGRKTFFAEAANFPYPIIFYESPYRAKKALLELKATGKEFIVVVGRELTKKFETIARGTLEEVLQNIETQPQKGEFAIVVYRQ
ncbi:MAG: 16S rRNA (cytidine(1402)-2'-O)-methyltransferase [Candidatus Wildermuthbacteria bacterium]|nr:16S rRNA (cytidine(1402)-2'-O)-methyltransferase [Candidatus Wildermuthbacteria bacterium]